MAIIVDNQYHRSGPHRSFPFWSCKAFSKRCTYLISFSSDHSSTEWWCPFCPVLYLSLNWEIQRSPSFQWMSKNPPAGLECNQKQTSAVCLRVIGNEKEKRYIYIIQVPNADPVADNDFQVSQCIHYNWVSAAGKSTRQQASAAIRLYLQMLFADLQNYWGVISKSQLFNRLLSITVQHCERPDICLQYKIEYMTLKRCGFCICYLETHTGQYQGHNLP